MALKLGADKLPESKQAREELSLNK